MPFYAMVTPTRPRLPPRQPDCCVSSTEHHTTSRVKDRGRDSRLLDEGLGHVTFVRPPNEPSLRVQPYCNRSIGHDQRIEVCARITSSRAYIMLVQPDALQENYIKELPPTSPTKCLHWPIATPVSDVDLAARSAGRATGTGSDEAQLASPQIQRTTIEA